MLEHACQHRVLSPMPYILEHRQIYIIHVLDYSLILTLKSNPTFFMFKCECIISTRQVKEKKKLFDSNIQFPLCLLPLQSS